MAFRGWSRGRIVAGVALTSGLLAAGAGCQPPEVHSIPDDGAGKSGVKETDGQGRFQAPDKDATAKPKPAPAGRAPTEADGIESR